MSFDSAFSANASAVSPARMVALSVLLSCQQSDETVDDLLDRRFKAGTADSRDRALAMELVYGVLRREETLDWRLKPLLKQPLARLPVIIQTVLRMGAYQLLYLDRIPPSAAVDESVRITRSYRPTLGRDWTALVNAVLRNLLRVPVPALPALHLQSAESLSILYAVPLWLCQRWIERLGIQAAEAACRAASEIPLLTLRVNRQRITRDALLSQFHERGIAARPTAHSPVGLIVDRGQRVTSLPGFETGLFYVEDEAAQLIPPLLDPQPGETILDACAAPGGKATHLSELMARQGRVLAMDRQKERLERLQENCGRLGASIVIPVIGDARTPIDALRLIPPAAASMSQGRDVTGAVDRVLLDAPCSGLGVLRRHPDAKRKKHTAMFGRHQQLQRELLEAVAVVSRPGGVLVYSTCSTEHEETEDVIGQFCHRHKEWMRESVSPWLPTTALHFVTAYGAFSTMGNNCGMDGFYAARIRKVS
jgi:16S rRNA (cytosine967-C5)-methyltransferase